MSIKIKVLVLDDNLDSASGVIDGSLRSFFQKDSDIINLLTLKGNESLPLYINTFLEEPIELIFVSNRGYETTAMSVAENVEQSKYSGFFDLVLVDDQWGDKDFGGQDILLEKVYHHIKGVTNELPIIALFTHHWDIDRLHRFYKLIYENYQHSSRIIPCDKSDKLQFLNLISRVANEKKLILERDCEREKSNFFQEIVKRINKEPPKESFCGIHGKSPQNQIIFHLIENYSKSQECVLLQGKTGTGKGLIAKAIHKTSNRNGKYEDINCAAIPETFLETELFGYDKKSGIANANPKGKIGKFELANNGTLFLDEIGKMPLLLQTKILKAVEDKKIKRVSGIEEIPLNIRIIAAASENLEEMASQGLFLPDLYYRLNVLSINAPELKDRKEDIDILAKHFLHKSKEAKDKNITSISENAINILINYSWPGNIRELENCIKRAIVICNGSEIKAENITIGKEDAQHTRIDNLSITQTLVTINNLEKILGEEVQDLRTKELDIAYQILADDKVIHPITKKPNYKIAGFLLKQEGIIKYNKDSTLHFHRYVFQVWQTLNPENQKKAQQNHPYLSESITLNINHQLKAKAKIKASSEIIENR